MRKKFKDNGYVTYEDIVDNKKNCDRYKKMK